jgi:lysophospholipase L1-like esterase
MAGMCQRRRVGLWGFALAVALAAAACGDSPTEPSPPPPAQLTLTCPAAQTAVSATGQPVTVTWQGPTAQGGTPPVTTNCTPASGSPFAVGTTTVGCVATSAAANQLATCAFPVTVTRPPQLSVSKFMAFGDSITWGQDSAPAGLLTYPVPAPSYSYPSQLLSILTAAYPGQTFTVANEGWPGERVAVGLSRLPSALATNAPEVVLLLEGANDLLASPSSATTQYIADSLRDMVRVCRTRVAVSRVLLATFPPQFVGVPPSRGAGAAFVPELNQRIAAVAQSEGATLVDLYAVFPAGGKPYIGADGLHPTEQGFVLMAQTFAKTIKEKFEVTPAAR